MARLLIPVVLVALWCAGMARAATPAIDPSRDALVVLSYHDVLSDLRGSTDRHAVSAAELVAHFTWLRANGFTPVSLDRVITARNGGEPLPPRAVLLTFDDGYRSFYTHVLPLLKLFDYPAVLAIVGSWLAVPDHASVPYEEGNPRPRSAFLSWDELREIARSGLVAVASHSYDLHHGVRANREGNTQPAATTRIFDAGTGQYESDDAYRARIHTDLARNSALIERELGIRPKAMVWPFGSYNHATLAIAASLGMPVTLTLDDGLNHAGVPLSRLRRVLIELNPTTQDLAWRMMNLAAEEPRRVVHLALDDIHHVDPAQQEARLSQVLDRLHRLQVNTVVLIATSPTGEGVATYFPNRRLRTRGDLLNRVAWQLISRLRVDVLVHLDIGDAMPDRAAQAEVYTDLGRYAHFSGLYFTERARGDAAALTQATLAHRAPLRTVLSFDLTGSGDAQPMPSTTAIAASLDEHDHVAVRVRAASDPSTLRRAVDALRAHRDGPQRALVELCVTQTPEDRMGLSRQLASQFTQLQRLGARNVGYQLDAPAVDFPVLEVLRPSLSLGAQPR